MKQISVCSVDDNSDIIIFKRTEIDLLAEIYILKVTFLILW